MNEFENFLLKRINYFMEVKEEEKTSSYHPEASKAVNYMCESVLSELIGVLAEYTLNHKIS